MADKIFHTGFVEKASPVGADKIMISDSEATNQTKFTDIANLPVSTPTSTAIGVVQSDINAHEARTDNPHSVTKAQVGLSDVDNTSDATKNTAVATLTNKTLTSPVINSPTGIVKGDVGLGNVDNTSDVDKPISTATQTALDGKQDTLTGLTATPTELNILDGATLSTTELNYVDGVTSNIQTQLDTKSSLTQIQDNTKQDLSLALTPNYDAINGAIVLDSSKNHFHGTVSGATYIPNGGLNGGGVYDFDGVDDYIELNDGMVIKSTSISDKETNISGLTFSGDGIYMYICGDVSDSVHQYTLSTAWDITTKSFTRSASITAQDTTPNSLRFSVDGLKMYVLGATGDDITYYTLGTAWDISTLTYVGEYAIGNGETTPSGLFIRPDGLKFYVVGGTMDTVYQYSMSVAWDMSTASYDSISLSIAAKETQPQGLFFKDDGTKMYLIGTFYDTVREYTLGTAWNVSTGTASGVDLYIGQDGTPTEIFIGDSGTKLYIAGWSTDTIYQYNLYTPYSFSNPIYSNGFTIIADINPDIASGRIIDKTYNNNSAVTGHQAYLEYSGVVSYRINVGTVITTPVTTFPIGTMKRMAISVSSAGATTIYANGVSAATGTTGLPSTLTVSTKTRLGNGSLRTDSPYGGYIGNVRIFSRVLTATEIANDYLQRTEIDNPPEVPRLTTTMRDAGTWEEGQTIYNRTTQKTQTYNGSTWNDLY